MKKFASLLAVVFAAGVAYAQAPAEKPAATKAPAKEAKAAAKTHDVQAEVVSVDVEKKTLTLKGDIENKTVPVEGKAIAKLKTIKSGDKYTLTCRDNEAGEHQAVTAIKAPEKK